ncbi:hypothetical protein LOTGIDRAFT_232515 [Lottia gigantea]|uniref:Immunoglobulin-binding protein 1 n=1 Tax=Lottia gigantea TaxID=225164 RepID=V3ZS56_LOTGI|nr:hypothetical protein LOTGIDRAFT_232515 [Lottia gigantea]ESO94278.1 hypothetical protein LOTGIDRAFT_232515 [Lottia gigantea]
MAQAENEGKNLSEMFEDILKIYNYLDTCDDPTVSDKYQAEVDKGVKICHESIKMVNTLQLFSNNESIEEVATNEIKYMLLSALLGYLSLKSIKESRIHLLNRSKGYYTDYLKLYKSYGVQGVDVADLVEEEEEEKAEDEQKQVALAGSNRGPDLRAMSVQRASKIERFKQKRDIENKLKDLRTKVEDEHVDDEVKREYYLTMLNEWAAISIEEIDSISFEIPVLEHSNKMKEKEGKGPKLPQLKPKTKPLRPFILTKDLLQKQVFGAGYPSIATMTIDEFYHQKVAEGDFHAPGSGAQGHSLQDFARDPDKDKEELEKEASEKENLFESDDPVNLIRERNWDEWKDDHRRGWGNRKNRS